jgi:hypothetical protein
MSNGTGLDVHLATATHFTDPDEDDAPLHAALAAIGVRAQTRAWDDRTVDWSAARLCVLRSTWNYVQHHDAFLAWIDRVSTSTRLWNPAAVVRWNTHKGYLLELAAQGLPVIPTRLVPRGAGASLAELARDWPDLVIKPAVSAGSFGTIRVGRDRLDEGQRHLDGWGAGRDMLVQPYLPSVETYGERACVWIDGAFTHAIRKGARFSGDGERVSEALPLADDERDVAERVLAAAPRPLLYARVDLARDDEGRALLMELELVEPSLYVDRAPEACARLARAISRLL